MKRIPRPVAPSVLAALACALALAGVAGCGEEALIAKGPALVAGQTDTEAVKDTLRAEDALWNTLDARCDLAIQSRYIVAPGGQVALRGGRLRISKPGMISLTMPESGTLEVRLVGDGRTYMVDMPVFQQRYSGKYGDPLPSGRTFLPLMPDDVVDAFALSGIFYGKVQALRQDGFGFTLESLEPVQEPQPRLVFRNSLVLRPQDARPWELFKYNDDGTIRVHVTFPTATPVQTGNVTAEVPGSIWLGYQPGQTSIMISLRDIELNKPLDPNTFRVGQ